MPDLPELTSEAFRLSKLLDDALAYLRKLSQESSEAENEYRKAKSQAWLEAPEGTVPEREAWVNGITADARQRRDLADGMRQAALEAVRSRRQQISVLQSVLAAHKSEAEFANYGPDRGVA